MASAIHLAVTEPWRVDDTSHW